VVEIELADAVAAVRDELVEAAARGVGQAVSFTVGPIEMEFAVELRADARAKAGSRHGCSPVRWRAGWSGGVPIGSCSR
jgi:hypothetical protein